MKEPLCWCCKKALHNGSQVTAMMVLTQIKDDEPFIGTQRWVHENCAIEWYFIRSQLQLKRQNKK